MKVAVFGLGAMGAPVAARLAAAGHAVSVRDADPAREAAFRGAAPHAPEEAEAVFLLVSDAAATEALLATLLPRLRPGTLLIDHGTAPPALLRDAAARRPDVALADAPLSGGAAGARDGTLVAFLGADPAAAARAVPLLRAHCATVAHLGPLGAGCVAKAANQVAIAGAARGLAEAAALARAGGLDPDAVLAALAAGSAASAQLPDARRRLGAAADPGGADFRAAYGWLHKDLAIALALADLPLARLVRDATAA